MTKTMKAACQNQTEGFDTARAIQKNLIKEGAIQPDFQEYPENDSGRAEHFVDIHQGEVRFVPDWGCWLIWEKHRWRRDSTNQITHLAIEHHRKLQTQIVETFDNPKARAQALQKTLKMGDAKTLRDMLSLASADPRIVVESRQLDSDPNLLGLKNGVWDFSEGKFRPGRPEDLITRQVSCAYADDATAPKWRAFIKWATREDDDLAVFLQRMAGYSFTGHISEEAWFFHYGAGGNGKSVFCETLKFIAGEGEYGVKVQSSLYIANKYNKQPEDQIWHLQGARIALGPEVEQGERLAEARIKEITTSGITLEGRLQYARGVKFVNQAKLWLYGNHYPDIRGVDDGTWRRIKLVPWLASITDSQKDKSLSQSLMKDEAEGILRWILEGAQDWMRTKSLATPACVREASDAYRVQEDVLVDYIEGELLLGDKQLWTSRTGLFEHFTRWCERSGVTPWQNKSFFKRIRHLAGVSDHKQNGIRGFSGVYPKP
jgi:putative DNA primase/helicase